MNLDSVFKITDVDYEKVIIEVNAKDPLTVAHFSFLASNYNYITVTRGTDHMLTVILDTGETFNFWWGESGYELISDSLKRLKNNVLAFINSKHIMLDYTGQKVNSACIYYNSNYDKWQLALDVSTNPFRRENVMWWSDTAHSVDEMINECTHFVTAEWGHATAETGIDIWNAISPVYTLK